MKEYLQEGPVTIEVTPQKIKEAEDLLLMDINHIDELTPQNILSELFDKVFGVRIYGSVRDGDSFVDRYNGLKSEIREVLKGIDKHSFAGACITYASDDGGHTDGYIVRMEDDPECRLLLSEEPYRCNYDYDSDPDGIVVGLYGLDDVDLMMICRLIVADGTQHGVWETRYNELMNDADKILSGMEKPVCLVNPVMVAFDIDGKWYNTVITRVYRYKLHSTRESFDLLGNIILDDAQAMKVVDAVVESMNA